MNYENLISIVMPVFNAQAYLEEALESVRRQTWTDWELLVVDDHSTDGSAGLVSEICKKDARIRLLSQTDGVKGAANARNFGTAHANGRYLAFMDADDIWRVDKLEREMAFLRARCCLTGKKLTRCFYRCRTCRARTRRCGGRF